MSFLRHQVKMKKKQVSRAISVSDTTTTTSTSSSGSSGSSNVDQQSIVDFNIHPSYTNLGVIDLQAIEACVKNDTTT